MKRGTRKIECGACSKSFFTAQQEPRCPDCNYRIPLHMDGGEIDPAVRLNPTKKAKCGHLSFNYYACDPCRRKGLGPKADHGFLNITRKVEKWDVRKMAYSEEPKVNIFEQQLRGPFRKGYSFCPDKKQFRVTFKEELVGWALSADEAHQMYLKRVEEYRNENEA